MSKEPVDNDGMHISIERDGPYVVHGKVPLVRMTQVVSEFGEPLAWKREERLETPEPYCLCRCGGSHDKPFCDGTHCEVEFDGTETAGSQPTAERRIAYPGGSGLIVRHDDVLCMNAGFCGNRLTDVEKLVPATGDTNVLSQVIAMVERCPSGSLTYALGEGLEDVEPDLPAQVAVTTEITSSGPVAGALWVTGDIPVERADGQPFEVRNRVTLCSCGRSKIKPLCDGTHRPKDETAGG